MDAYNAFNDYDFQLKRQNGMAPSRMISLPSIPKQQYNQTQISGNQVSGNTSIADTDEGIRQQIDFITNRLLTVKPGMLTPAQQQMKQADMQRLSELQKIAEVRQGMKALREKSDYDSESLRYKRDDERRERVRKQQEERAAMPATALTPVTGGREFVSAGKMTVNGRTMEAPRAGTVTDNIYKAQNAALNGQGAMPTEAGFTHPGMMRGMNRAYQQGDYNKAAAMGSDAMSEMGSIASGYNTVTPGAKAVFDTTTQNIASMGKSAGVNQEARIKGENNARVARINQETQNKKLEQDRKQKDLDSQVMAIRKPLEEKRAARAEAIKQVMKNVAEFASKPITIGAVTVDEKGNKVKTGTSELPSSEKIEAYRQQQMDFVNKYFPEVSQYDEAAAQEKIDLMAGRIREVGDWSDKGKSKVMSVEKSKQKVTKQLLTELSSIRQKDPVRLQRILQDPQFWNDVRSKGIDPAVIKKQFGLM